MPPRSRRGGRHRPLDLPDTAEAVVQIWAARTSGVRGLLAVHCWLVLKPAGAAPLERWDVVGRRARTGRVGLQRNARPPREGWGRHRAWLVLDRRGPKAAVALGEVKEFIAAYPHGQHYRAWPGPNCNSFVAHLARALPAMRTALPPLAIGKDWLPNGRLLAGAPSGTGWQLSLLGLAGVLVAAEEGIEISLGGVVFGWRRHPARLLLPGLGDLALGFSRLNRPFSPTA